MSSFRIRRVNRRNPWAFWDIQDGVQDGRQYMFLAITSFIFTLGLSFRCQKIGFRGQIICWDYLISPGVVTWCQIQDGCQYGRRQHIIRSNFHHIYRTMINLVPKHRFSGSRNLPRLIIITSSGHMMLNPRWRPIWPSKWPPLSTHYSL